MTDCPIHPKAQVRHTAVVIEWGSNAVMVQHFCPEGYDQDSCEGRGHQWLEEALDEKAVLAKVGLNPPARWAERLRDCQEEAKQLMFDRDHWRNRARSLTMVADEAWRLLDTGVAHGPDAMKAMVMLQDALIAYDENYRPMPKRGGA